MVPADNKPFSIVIIGQTVTSSWGNDHAVLYRNLLKGLHAFGKNVLFLEQDTPPFTTTRDMTDFPYATIVRYPSVEELKYNHSKDIQDALLVIVGSRVPRGTEVIDWVQNTAKGTTAFYDIDTPATLSSIAAGDCDYLLRKQVPGFDLYLSVTGGSVLTYLSQKLRAKSVIPFYRSVDESMYFPEPSEKIWDMGYSGAYNKNRQGSVQELLILPAEKLAGLTFIVAGAQYPAYVRWPRNVRHIEHLPPGDHCRFYNRQRFSLNVATETMIQWGYSPDTLLLEAAACEACIISDYWEGIDSFFEPGKEILMAHEWDDVVDYLKNLREDDRLLMGARARQKILKHHTGRMRALELLQLTGLHYPETSYLDKKTVHE